MSIPGRYHVHVLISIATRVPAPLQLEKNTPLHMAVEGNWRDISFYLIHNGADVNAENVLQRTPLHMAATHGRLEIGMMLLKGGSNPDKVRDSPGFCVRVRVRMCVRCDV